MWWPARRPEARAVVQPLLLAVAAALVAVLILQEENLSFWNLSRFVTSNTLAAPCTTAVATATAMKGHRGSNNDDDDDDAAAAMAIVREILRVGNAGESRRGKAHRSMVCTMARNDLHLREYLVRSLLAGFGHIVLYDNNQLTKGYDLDSRTVVAPFVAAGAVTLVPWDQNTTNEHIDNNSKNVIAVDCVDRYGAAADWVMTMDTDEVLYLEERCETHASDRNGTNYPEERARATTATGVMARFLDALEERATNTCGLHFPWRMMYGEHRILTHPGELLMDAYPRVCKRHFLPKLFFRPERSVLNGMPHGMACNNTGGVQFGSDDEALRRLLPEYLPHSKLIHYYQKSMQEWLTKLEQSIPPYIRYIHTSYDGDTSCNEGKTDVGIDAEHARLVRGFVARLRAFDGEGGGDGGRWLGYLPEFSRQDFEASGAAKAAGPRAFELYLFFKLRVAQRQEWDEDLYLQSHPGVAEAIVSGKYIDGLQHFINEGFADLNETKAASSYFKPEPPRPLGSV